MPRPPLSFTLAFALLGLASSPFAPAQDRTVLFDTGAAGVSKAITEWGLDTAWPSPDNMRRGIIYMGADQVDHVRISFPVNAPLVNGELAPEQLSGLVNRLNIAALAGAGKPVSMTPDTEAGVDPWFKNGSQVVPARWVEVMEATQRALQARGKTLVSAAPFNEPDYGWNQGTVGNLYDILGLLQTSPTFAGVALAGPSTLSCDAANTWYNPIKDRVTEGTTHQLAGGFDSYAAFFQNVRASGDRAVNEELHNVVEAIVGAEYGVQTGVWWASAELTRGSFVKANQGVRLGYAEHRPNWTAAAVYRAPSGAVQAFVGASERQAVTTSFRFVAKDRPVFYDGHGPRRVFTVTIPGGNGYWVDQPNAEKLVNITWGPDVPPPVGGRYTVVNRHSGKILEVANASTGNGANIRQNAPAGASATHQQWDITPLDSRAGGDYSYFTFTAAHSGKAADVLNFSYNDGANIIQWEAANGANQQWFFEYVGEGWFTIRNRWSGKALEVDGYSTANGANVQQWAPLNGFNQHWRLLPVGAGVEFAAPPAPVGLTATARDVSVRLDWQPVAAADLAGYTVLRSTTSANGPFDTLARGVTGTTFTDGSAHRATTYHYRVRATDHSLNRSAYSLAASATPSAAPALVAHLAFEGAATDSSGNANHAELVGATAYAAGRVGPNALALNGADAFANLPAEVANHDEFTFAAWVYWQGGAAWQRIFDFGNDTDQYLFLTPAASGAGLRFAIKNGGAEQRLDAPALVTGRWIHVAVALGASDAGLYVNGTRVAASTAITLKPSDFAPVLNHLGKSQFPDPLFNGRLDEVRLYNHALTAGEIAALAAGPLPAPTGLAALPGPEQIALSWNAVPFASSYTVSVATSATGPFTPLVTGLTSPTYVHGGLSYGTTYHYRIEAENLGGPSPASGAVNTTPESALITEAERASVRVTVEIAADQSTTATLHVPASVPGHAYRLQHTPDLLVPWLDIGEPVPGTGQPLTAPAPPQAPAPRAFYRATISR